MAFLKAFSGFIANEALYRDFCSVCLGYLIYVLLYALLAVFCLYVDLVQQAYFLQFLVQAAHNSAENYLLRFVGHLRILSYLLFENFNLMILVFLRHFRVAGVLRFHGCCLHSNILAHFSDGVVYDIRLNVYQNADLAAGMNVACYKTILLFNLFEAADLKVLADNSNAQPGMHPYLLPWCPVPDRQPVPRNRGISGFPQQSRFQSLLLLQRPS